MLGVPVSAKKTSIRKICRKCRWVALAPQFQCCQALSKMHDTEMDVFFAAQSTRSQGLPNIEIGGRGG